MKKKKNIFEEMAAKAMSKLLIENHYSPKLGYWAPLDKLDTYYKDVSLPWNIRITCPGCGCTFDAPKDSPNAHCPECTASMTKSEYTESADSDIIPLGSIRIVCEHCGRRFDKVLDKNKIEPICPECAAEKVMPGSGLSRLNCIKCGKRFDVPFEPVHLQGSFEYLCVDCKEPLCIKPKINICVICQKRVVSEHHDLGFRCAECLAECLAKKKCPVCTVNLISKDQSVCVACSKKIAQEQSSKSKDQRPKPKVGQRKVRFDGDA